MRISRIVIKNFRAIKELDIKINSHLSCIIGENNTGNILCRKLTQERLYTTATILASPRTAADSGVFTDMSEMTSLKTFITSFAGHIAAEAART